MPLDGAGFDLLEESGATQDGVTIQTLPKMLEKWGSERQDLNLKK
jgi:hypothetical protein